MGRKSSSRAGHVMLLGTYIIRKKASHRVNPYLTCNVRWFSGIINGSRSPNGGLINEGREWRVDIPVRDSMTYMHAQCHSHCYLDSNKGYNLLGAELPAFTLESPRYCGYCCILHRHEHASRLHIELNGTMEHWVRFLVELARCWHCCRSCPSLAEVRYAQEDPDKSKMLRILSQALRAVRSGKAIIPRNSPRSARRMCMDWKREYTPTHEYTRN